MLYNPHPLSRTHHQLSVSIPVRDRRAETLDVAIQSAFVVPDLNDLSSCAERGGSLRGALEALQRRQRGRVHAPIVQDYDTLYEFNPIILWMLRM
ncbi:unnamed protein product [Leptidea sinapis]|uniref:Uncharacterized protein n=1 Tax=Leptidea sinapis TaxID=189913 RepID=A0A5E4QBW6_9NEOP|nr:unnamed protein product [Leptidea sinapis]